MYGNLVADSLAKKGANLSKTNFIKKPWLPWIKWWDAEYTQERISQYDADTLHREYLDRKKKNWTNRSKSITTNYQKQFCKCLPEVTNYFKKNSTVTIDQQICIVNLIQAGTHMEVYNSGCSKPDWSACTVKSTFWENNNFYHEVAWDDRACKTPTVLHLDHT